MSPDLPFDIIALVIDIVGANKNTDLLKELALVSHSFLQICSKHLFATVELRDYEDVPGRHLSSSKTGFVKLLKSRPDVVRFIRKLTYRVSAAPSPIFQENDHLLSSILLHLLPSFSRLNSLAISASRLNWNNLDTSLTSAFLRLMHLPTINHIHLSYIDNFPLSSLTTCVNLRLLSIIQLHTLDFPEIVEMMPKIRVFRTSGSCQLTRKLLHAKRQDGQPAFNFMDLRRISATLNDFESGDWDIQHLLQNAELLESFFLYIGQSGSIKGILSPGARILKVLDLTLMFNFLRDPFLGGICEELEALVGHNLLETLSLKVLLFHLVTVDFMGAIFQEVEKVLVKPGWSMLRQVSFKISIARLEGSRKLCELLQSLPDKYLSHLSKHKSIAFDYSAFVRTPGL